MLTIEYTDPDDMGGGLSFTHDLRTTSRQNWDLIALSMKSFAILKFYKEIAQDVVESLNQEWKD
jgi:hypothetical protein